MTKKIKRFFFLWLALLFIFEAWLWDVTGTLVASVVAFLPLQRWRDWIAGRVEHLSPQMTLTVFIIPALVLFPLKMAAMWLITQGKVMLGMLIIVLAKCVGLGVSSFLFHVCKPKLMEMRWVVRLYNYVLYLREKALRLIAPFKRSIRVLKKSLLRRLPQGRVLARIKKWRGKVARSHHGSK